ncbi:MAG: TIGR03987 family protein [Caldilineae bacterium]|nr:MAG: TIGR03987 family protein [Caldilineae bacterium]
MSTTVLLSVVFIIAALVCYSIGVWSERLARRLKGWHLLFFWLGFAADTAGTTLMGIVAGVWMLNIHTVTGMAAIVLMLLHASWASLVLLRKDERAIRNFHKFSVFVWLVWLIPFFSGMAMEMTRSG